MPLLLEAAPEAAVEMARVHGGGTTPLLAACLRGHTAVVRQLLAAAPQAATMQDGSLAPVHVTVGLQQPGMLRLLLEAAPQAALMAYPEGSLPIHLAAMAPDPACSAAMVRQLLDAAPAAAAARAENVSGYTALHLAAMRANAAAAAALVAAAPQAAGMRAGDNDRTPLEMALSAAARAALWEAHPEQHEEAENDDLPPPTSALNIKTARPLLAVVPPSVSLPLLVQQGDLTRPLFSEVVEHWPLTAAQWEQVPAPCPCLGTALPAVLQRSPAEAAALVARLPAADSARLRTFALALRRSQRRFDVYLPAELADASCACSTAELVGLLMSSFHHFIVKRALGAGMSLLESRTGSQSERQLLRARRYGAHAFGSFGLRCLM